MLQDDAGHCSGFQGVFRPTRAPYDELLLPCSGRRGCAGVVLHVCELMRTGRVGRFLPPPTLQQTLAHVLPGVERKQAVQRKKSRISYREAWRTTEVVNTMACLPPLLPGRARPAGRTG